MLETLVALSILALVTTAVAGALRSPSARLQNAAEASEMISAAQTARADAMRFGFDVVFQTGMPCGNASRVVFHSDGSAIGGPVCLSDDVVLVVSTVSGQLELQP